MKKSKIINSIFSSSALITIFPAFFTSCSSNDKTIRRTLELNTVWDNEPQVGITSTLITGKCTTDPTIAWDKTPIYSIEDEGTSTDLGLKIDAEAGRITITPTTTNNNTEYQLKLKITICKEGTTDEPEDVYHTTSNSFTIKDTITTPYIKATIETKSSGQSVNAINGSTLIYLIAKGDVLTFSLENEAVEDITWNVSYGITGVESKVPQEQVLENKWNVSKDNFPLADDKIIVTAKNNVGEKIDSLTFINGSEICPVDDVIITPESSGTNYTFAPAEAEKPALLSITDSDAYTEIEFELNYLPAATPDWEFRIGDTIVWNAIFGSKTSYKLIIPAKTLNDREKHLFSIVDKNAENTKISPLIGTIKALTSDITIMPATQGTNCTYTMISETPTITVDNTTLVMSLDLNLNYEPDSKPTWQFLMDGSKELVGAITGSGKHYNFSWANLLLDTNEHTFTIKDTNSETKIVPLSGKIKAISTNKVLIPNAEEVENCSFDKSKDLLTIINPTIDATVRLDSSASIYYTPIWKVTLDKGLSTETIIADAMTQVPYKASFILKIPANTILEKNNIHSLTIEDTASESEFDILRINFN